jgi:thiol-disulfide isomerase/thioredoxin
MQKKIWLTIVLAAIILAIVWLELAKPHQGPVITAQQAAQDAAGVGATGSFSNAAGSSASSSSASIGSATPPAGATASTPAKFLASRAAIVHQESTQYTAAAEITNPSGWINTQPFTLASLIGNKVALVDFWTYSCINCVRTIPYLNAWYAKYKDAGLVILGVHSPEFQFEHNLANVQAAVAELGIHYPVVLDNNLATWSAYQNLYWPHEYLINIDGFIVDDNIGEGNYNKTEAAIQQALKERDAALGISTSNIPTGFVAPSDTIAINFSAIQSPETYFGSARNGYLANGPAMTDGTYSLTAPDATIALKPNSLYLGGTWDFEDQYATNQTAGATITYPYNSKNVYFVAASGGAPITVKVLLDGQPVPASMAGADVSAQGTLTIQANRLYSIVQGTSYGAHTLELIVQNPGLQAYTFTFG